MPKRSISKGGTRGSVYRAAALQRMMDAEVLFDADRFPGAVYLAGYAIECHLKYCVCQQDGQVYLESALETHSWDVLVKNAGLNPRIRQNTNVAAVYQDTVEMWTTSLRYNPEHRSTSKDSTLYKQLRMLYDFLAETVP